MDEENKVFVIVIGPVDAVDNLVPGPLSVQVRGAAELRRGLCVNGGRRGGASSGGWGRLPPIPRAVVVLHRPSPA